MTIRCAPSTSGRAAADGRGRQGDRRGAVADRPRRPRQFDATMAALGADDPHDTPAMSWSRRLPRDPHRRRDVRAPLAIQNGQGGSQFVRRAARAVATCVKAGVPTRVYMVQLGGFDTHADERGTQQRLLQTLDEALTPFLTEMATDPHGKDVVVMAYSEFGRRVAANASQGTDHGTAGPVFVAGAPVQGRVLRGRAEPDRPRRRRSQDHHRLSRRLLRRAGPHHRRGPDPAVGAGRTDLGFL